MIYPWPKGMGDKYALVIENLLKAQVNKSRAKREAKR